MGAIDHVRLEEFKVTNINILTFKFAHFFDLLILPLDKW